MAAAIEIDLAGVEVLLCDADGNLFPSEGPAFEACCGVINRLMATRGVERRFDPEELRLAATGMPFRSTATALLAEAGVDPLAPAELKPWIEEERRAVTAHLGATLRPDPSVLEPLGALGERMRLAAVSSSACSRLEACFEVTGLAELIPAELRFSAEDSLPEPTSKPDPAIYAHAVERLGLAPSRALAVEDSPPGVLSAVGAGVPTIGNLVFVPEPERGEREVQLRQAGAAAIVSSWDELRELAASEDDPAGGHPGAPVLR